MRRDTGGNRFISADSSKLELMAAIERGIDALIDWGDGTDYVFDPGAITVETTRIADGRISVSVEGDLATRHD